MRAFDGNLDVIDDEVAAGEHVAAAPGRADDEIAGGRRANLERKAPCFPDGFLHHARDAVEMAEADGELGRAVDDSDLGLLHVLVAQAERFPLGAAYGLTRGPGLEVAAERFAGAGVWSWHSDPQSDVIYQALGQSRVPGADRRFLAHHVLRGECRRSIAGPPGSQPPEIRC